MKKTLPELDLDKTRLTEFPSHDEEIKPAFFETFFSKYLKFSTAKSSNESGTSHETADSSTQYVENEARASTASSNASTAEERNVPNVLKRISMVLKSSNLQSYEETELRQYWMPDSVAKECYECSEKFTTWRRRHHCRVCGHIFCWKCCSQEISGKIIGCTGELRVCTYCCKVVLSYLQSSNVNVQDASSSDIRALQQDIQSKLATPTNGNVMLPGSASMKDLASPASMAYSNSLNSLNATDNGTGVLTSRKISVGYQEENFLVDRQVDTAELCAHRTRTLKQSASLRQLYDDIYSVSHGFNLNYQNDRSLMLATHKFKFQYYNECFTGSNLVDWLINHDKASSRVQATAIGQALLECGYLESVVESTGPLPAFFDSSYGLYRPCSPDVLDNTNQSNAAVEPILVQEPDEPSWVREIVQSGGNVADVDAEDTKAGTNVIEPQRSSFYLDLDLTSKAVHLIRAVNDATPQSSDNTPDQIEPQLQTFLGHHIHAIDVDHKSSQVFEKKTLKAFNYAWQQHGNALLSQFLNDEGLTNHWKEIVQDLIGEVVDVIQPNMDHNLETMDVRDYVRVKAVPGSVASNSCVVRGIVCSKNVAHRKMDSSRRKPKILLLACPLVYQRNEGKLMSLEPIMMQENEYLRNMSNRIISLEPDVVLISRNASRIVQEHLFAAKIVLVTNVKMSILKRLARVSNADIITSIDAANVARGSWRMASCQNFYTKIFHISDTQMKTLMFFDGLPLQHLGSTVLLRGGTLSELKRLKKVTSRYLYACYNWKLERAFLMDEYAKPPINDEILCDLMSSKESSPEGLDDNKKVVEAKEIVIRRASEELKMTTVEESDECLFQSKSEGVKKLQTIDDDILQVSISQTECVVENVENKFNDPLHNFNDDDVFTHAQIEPDQIQPNEPTNSNRFRKALDDTILSVSPFLQFTMPYLETESGQTCALRKFFPRDMYTSSKFDGKVHAKKRLYTHDSGAMLQDDCRMKKAPHEFVTEKLTAPISDSSVQSMLAIYRACGGVYDNYCFSPNRAKVDVVKSTANEIVTDHVNDALDFDSHQTFSVMLCSFSSRTNGEAFCVGPCIIEMEFYGKNDTALGYYLQRYCFRENFTCPSDSCDTPMLYHVRRFVHNNGCVKVTLNKHDQPLTRNNEIITWNWCTECNKITSPFPQISDDTWQFSFAKFLELKFYASMYTQRNDNVNDDDKCTHSLHHKHHQYFGCNNIVASFVYEPIQLWEISLPSKTIEFESNTILYTDKIIDEIRVLSLKGHEIYSTVLEKLTSLPIQDDNFTEFKQLLAKEQAHFKSQIESVQMKLTSPSIETNRNLTDVSAGLVMQLKRWQLEDAITIIKRLVAEACDVWNGRFTDILRSTKFVGKSSLTNSGQGNLSNTKNSLFNITMDEEVEGLSPEKVSETTTPVEFESSVLERAVDIVNTKHENDTCESKLDERLDVLLDSCEVADRRTSCDSNYAEKLESKKSNMSDTSSVISNSLVPDDKKDVPDKKTMKTLLSQFLQPNSDAVIIPSPFATSEHYLLPLNKSIPLVLYRNELSSIIAYALTTNEYRKALDELSGVTKAIKNSESSPGNRRRADVKTDVEPSLSSEINADGLVKNYHVDVEFKDKQVNFMCRVHYAEQFSKFRKLVMARDGDDDVGESEMRYIRSLSRSATWNARGGKSGTAFMKTKDDRFILKEMTKAEMDMFLNSATNYFDYMNKCLSENRPTLLGKIVGVYRVCYQYANKGGARRNLLVMENLFYKCNVKQKFDLKGSVRNRLVNPIEADGSENVLLDENLLKMSCESPLYICSHSKTVLTKALNSDTAFLAAQLVMDYSLLVGLDETSKRLVIGIIDYIRVFTWDKRIETMVKKSGILGGQGKLPTIVSPLEYQNRFIDAMHRYFLHVPDRWSLGKLHNFDDE